MTDPIAPQILIVDDARDIREPLGQYLRKQGFRTRLAANAAEAREIVAEASVHLVVLDIMMPGEDGLSLCRFVTDKTDIPVIFISAKTEETERIIGLELGADDYITKPFSPRELVARIKVVLRRADKGGAQQNGTTGGAYQFSGWTLKCDKRSLIDADGVNISLSTGEYQMLLALVSRAGKVLNRDQLLDITQGREAHAFDRAVDNQISRLRRKIENDPKNPEIIKTVWGGGYVLAGEVKSL